MSRALTDGCMPAERALRSDHPLGRRLLLIDPAEGEQPDHPLSLEEWATLLAAYDAPTYHGPPLPVEPSAAISKEARLLLYAERAASGVALHHPGDLIHRLGEVAGGLDAGVLDVRETYTRVRGLQQEATA